MEKYLGRHIFTFNPEDNGGESLSLETEIFDNGDGEIVTNQSINLQSYCNSAAIELHGAQITPDTLRQCANELEKALNKAEAQIEKNKKDK